MVKKIAIFFAYFIFFAVALIYFTPKSSVYYFLETQLKNYDVTVSSEEITDRGFTLNIEDANIAYKAIDSANVAEMNIKIFAIYNSMNLKNIVLSSTAKSFVPLDIASIKILYSIFNPLNIYAHGAGGFGKVNVKFNIVEMTLHLDLKPSRKMLKDYKSTLKNLKKTENGEFTYDKTF